MINFLLIFTFDPYCISTYFRYDALKSQGLKEERLLLLESWRDAEAAVLQQAAVGEGKFSSVFFVMVHDNKYLSRFLLHQWFRLLVVYFTDLFLLA